MNSYEPLAHRPEFSPRSLLRSLWKQRVSFGITWLVVSVGGAVLVRKLPAVYQAETLIQVEARGVPEKYVSAAVDIDAQDRLSVLSQQIKSYTRLMEIIQKYDIYREERRQDSPEEIVEKMRNDLKIKLEKGWSKDRTFAFRVSYQGPDAKLVAQVANHIGYLFIDENARTREGQAVGASEFIESEFAKAKTRLEKQEEKVSSYKLQYSGELPQQEQTLHASLGRLQLQYQALQDAIGRAQQNLILLRNSVSSAQATQAALAGMATAEVAASRGAGTVPARPLKRSEQLTREMESLRGRYNADHPEMKRLQAELARTLQREQDQGDAEPSGSLAGPRDEAGLPSSAALSVVQSSQRSELLLRERERIEDLKSQVAITEKQLESLRGDQVRVLSEITSTQSRLEKLPLREQQLAALTRDYEISKSNYQSLLDKKLSANLAADMERRQKSERFSVIDVAQVPRRPIKPDRLLLVAVGSGIGLALGALIAVGREMRTNVLLGEWELPSDIWIVGRVPRIKPPVLDSGESALIPAEEDKPRRSWPPALVSRIRSISLLRASAARAYVRRARS